MIELLMLCVLGRPTPHCPPPPTPTEQIVGLPAKVVTKPEDYALTKIKKAIGRYTPPLLDLEHAAKKKTSLADGATAKQQIKRRGNRNH